MGDLKHEKQSNSFNNSYGNPRKNATNQKLLNDEIGANHIKEATRINNNTNTDNSDGNYGNAHDNKRSPSISRNYHFSN